MQTNTLNAMHIAVFVHKEMKKKIKNIHGTNIATGFIGAVGNKGATAIAMKIENIKILFVNSHLQSGQQKQISRRLEFKKIEKKLKVREEYFEDANNLSKYISDKFD